MPRQDTKLESEGAEFLVLGQLLIEGIPAYKTYTNLRGYDLVATCPETKQLARIQVKSRWATTAPHFLIKNVDECDFIVLVRLNRGVPSWDTAKRPLLAQDPEYYVLTGERGENTHKPTWDGLGQDLVAKGRLRTSSPQLEHRSNVSRNPQGNQNPRRLDNMTYDLIIIGSGPGGYVCAIRAAQLGMRRTLSLIEVDAT